MKYIAKTLYGLESVLAGELESMGASDVMPLNRAVAFAGSREMLYRVNYCARTALSVLMPVADFRIRSADELYRILFKDRLGEIHGSGTDLFGGSCCKFLLVQPHRLSRTCIEGCCG